MARVLTSAGMVEKTTTLKEMVPKDDEERQPLPDAFEYMASLTPEKWEDHIGYLYRMVPSPNPGKGVFLCKFTQPITIEWIAQRYGGLKHRVFIRKASGERMADSRYDIEAPPKLQSDPANYDGAPANGHAATIGGQGDLARHAMDLVADPGKASIGIALQTAQTGFDIVRAQMAASVAQNQLSVRDIIELLDKRQAAASAPSMPPWLETALAAAIPALLARILTPENPIETFKNLASALQSMPGMKGGGSDWKASIVEVLPQLAERGTQMMQEWRLATEAAAGAQRHLPPAGPVLVTQPMAAANSTPPPAAAVPAPGAGSAGVTPTPGGPLPPPPDQWLKMKLVEMFRAGRSGEDVGIFLEEIAPAFLQQLTPIPPPQLQGFLRIDPILAAIADDPRMPEFLQQLHDWANEIEPAAVIQDIAAEAAATQKPA